MNSFSAGTYPSRAVLSTEPKYVYNDEVVNQFSETSEVNEFRNKLRNIINERKGKKGLDPAITRKMEAALLRTYPESKPVSGDVEFDDDLIELSETLIQNLRNSAYRVNDPGMKAKIDIEANVLEKTIGDLVDRQKSEKKSKVTYDEVDRLDAEVGREFVPDPGVEEPFDAPPMSFLSDEKYEEFYNEWKGASSKKAKDAIIRGYSEEAGG